MPIEVEGRFLVGQAQIQVATRDRQLIALGRAGGHDLARRRDDAAAADHFAALFLAGLGHAHNPGAVLIGARLHDQVVVEHGQVVMFRRGVVHRRVVAEQDHLGPLQAHHTIGFRPAAVIAQGHAHHAAKAPPDAEFAARLEVALLQMLEGAPRLMLIMSGQMDLAVLPDYGAVLPHQDRGIETALDAALDHQLGIAQVEPDAQLARRVEQHLSLRTRHLAFIEGIQLGRILHIPARKESRERQLRKDHQLAPHGVRLAQMRQQALDDIAAAIAALDRPELRGRDVDDA